MIRNETASPTWRIIDSEPPDPCGDKSFLKATKTHASTEHATKVKIAYTLTTITIKNNGNPTAIPHPLRTALRNKLAQYLRILQV